MRQGGAAMSARDELRALFSGHGFSADLADTMLDDERAKERRRLAAEGRCTRCGGTGKLRTFDEGGIVDCGVCGGTGETP